MPLLDARAHAQWPDRLALHDIRDVEPHGLHAQEQSQQEDDDQYQ